MPENAENEHEMKFVRIDGAVHQALSEYAAAHGQYLKWVAEQAILAYIKNAEVPVPHSL